MCNYLKGKQLKFKTRKDAILLFDKEIVYLRDQDIDKSGRGYFFPRYGQIRDYWKKQINIDGDWVSLSSIIEIVENEGQYSE